MPQACASSFEPIGEPWEGTATELRAVPDSSAPNASRVAGLLRHGNSTGIFLKKLCESRPDLVQVVSKADGINRYLIEINKIRADKLSSR